jgi:hypothetical protein
VAYGFRHVPKVRTAAPLYFACEHCGASDYAWPHFCKETTPGTALAPTMTLPYVHEMKGDGK